VGHVRVARGLTAHSGRESTEYWKDYGFDMHLVKPVEIKALQDLLATVCLA